MNTVLAVFAVLVSAWAWLSARNARRLSKSTRTAVNEVARILHKRLRALVDEAERKPVQPLSPTTFASSGRGFPQPLPFPPAPRPVEEAAPRADGGEPPAAPLPGRAAPSPRPAHGGGKQGPSQATRELAAKAKQVLARRGDVAPVELRDELGLTIKGFAKVRALLNADPDVVTYGQTKNRRYKLRDGAPTNGQRQRIAAEAGADGRAPKMPTTPGPKKGRQEPKVDGRILSAVQLMPKSARALSDDLHIPFETVVKTLHALEAEGDVRRHESGNWVLVP